MADIQFSVDWDITPAEQKQNKLQREFEESEAKLKNLTDQHKKTLDLIEAEKKKQADITEEIKRQDAAVEELNRKQALIQSGKATAAQQMKWGSVGDLQNQIDAINNSTSQLELTQGKSLSTQQKLEETYAKESLELQKQENKTKNIADNIALTNQQTEETSKSAKHAANSFEKFTKRIVGLAKRVFIFSLITKALRALRKAIAERISGEERLGKYLAEIKGNLAVIGTTIFETAKPIIEWILQKVAYLTQLLSVILARVLKKDVKEMANFAKQSQKAQKAAEKTTASWDTLQQIKGSESDSSGGVSASFEQFDMQKWTDEQLTKIEALAAGALLALGVILCFSGINIPLGIALIAAGAALLVREVAPNWSALSNETKRQIALITAIASAAMLAIGIILCIATGFNPLGIALIAMGVVGLVTSAVIALNTMPDDIKSTISKIMGIVGTALLVIGIILCVTGVGIPIGLALIAAGAASLVTAAVANKDKIIEWVQGVADKVKGIFDWLFDTIWDKFGDKIINAQHAIANFLNKIINAINNVLAKILNTGWASTLFNAIGVDTSNWRIPPISYLAQGAVIPGGKPFMAVMGDQPSGKTNLEAPEDLIRQIVREESGNININFTGSLAQLARVLNPEITREQNRSTMWTGARV